MKANPFDLGTSAVDGYEHTTANANTNESINMKSPTPLTVEQELVQEFTKRIQSIGVESWEWDRGGEVVSNLLTGLITTLTTQHTKEKEEIVRKLDRYIEHRIECIKQFEEDAECDCGLTETLHYIT